MSRQLLQGNPPITVDLRQSARARRLSLRISRLDGRVTLTMPKKVSEREALRFLESREEWLRGHLTELAPEVRVTLGGTVQFEGRETSIVVGKTRSAKLVDGRIEVPDQPDKAGARVRALLKLLARDRLAQASDHYAALLGRPYGRLTLRDTRSRWGSCSSDGDLMYSWRLVMAPPEVLTYVAAHEVAHLAEMNHSPAFWRVVTDLYPDHAAARRWLKDNGDTLHRVRFND